MPSESSSTVTPVLASSVAGALMRSDSLIRRWATLLMRVEPLAKAASTATVGTRSGQEPMSRATPCSSEGYTVTASGSTSRRAPIF